MLRKAISTIAMAAALASSAVAQVVNRETEGNLAPTRLLGCVPAAQADVMLNPADLAESVLVCFSEGQDDRAAELLIMMQLRARFDAKRVADKTARLGGQVLSLTLSERAGPQWADRIKPAAGALLRPGSKRFREFCALMRRQGPPQYHPDYMIQHGMNAFLSSNEEELVAGFDGEREWSDAVDNYLRCE